MGRAVPAASPAARRERTRRGPPPGQNRRARPGEDSRTAPSHVTPRRRRPARRDAGTTSPRSAVPSSTIPAPLASRRSPTSGVLVARPDIRGRGPRRGDGRDALSQAPRPAGRQRSLAAPRTRAGPEPVDRQRGRRASQASRPRRAPATATVIPVAPMSRACGERRLPRGFRVTGETAWDGSGNMKGKPHGNMKRTP